MPQASYKTTIDATYDHVSALLVDKMEWPKKYVGGILYSSILERGEGFLMREMYQPPPVDLRITEKIYFHDVPDGQEFVYEHVDNPTYTGTFRNIVTRIPGTTDKVELEYVQSWDPKAGQAEKFTDDEAQRNVENAVEHLKHLAESPVEVPDWVRAFYAVVDAMGSDEMAPLLADNVKFRMANGPEILGRDTVVAGSRGITKMFAGIKHDYVSVDEVNGKTFVDCWVTYEMFDGKAYVLPFMTVFERPNGEITNVRIFGDMSPLKHGWPA